MTGQLVGPLTRQRSHRGVRQHLAQATPLGVGVGGRRQRQAQDELDSAAKEIEENESLSFFEKLQRTSQEASDTQRRFDLKKERLDKDLKTEIDALKASEQLQIEGYESRIRWLAVLLAPAPALLLGIIVLGWRAANERRQITPDRRV